MTTGLISYKLCTHDYRCEECLFDKVMRDEAAAAAGSYAGTPAGTAPMQVRGSLPQRSREALFYHRGHCWTDVEGPDEVRIGIDGILAALVAGVKAVALPRPGEDITKDQCFAHIIQEKHIIPLHAPLTGTVTTVNEQLRRSPDMLADEAWENSWLVTLQPENLEQDLRPLLFGTQALAWYHKKEQELSAALSTILCRNSPHLGPTLQDGGERISGLAGALTPEQYYQILESVCRSEETA